MRTRRLPNGGCIIHRDATIHDRSTTYIRNVLEGAFGYKARIGQHYTTVYPIYYTRNHYTTERER